MNTKEEQSWCCYQHMSLLKRRELGLEDFVFDNAGIRRSQSHLSLKTARDRLFLQSYLFTWNHSFIRFKLASKLNLNRVAKPPL